MTLQAPARSLADFGDHIGLAIGRHLDHAFRRVAHGRGVVDDPSFLRLLSGEPHPLGNFAVLTAGDLSSARAAVDPLAVAPVPSAVLFPSMQVSSDVADYLAQRGYQPAGALPAMGVEISAMAQAVLPAGYELTLVDRNSDGTEWVRQFALGYELPLGVAAAFSPARDKSGGDTGDSLEFYEVRKAGVIVATSVCCLHDGMAGIYCVSTIPAERRNGLGACATAEPLRRAAQRGYNVGVLQSSEAGYPVYRKLGFTDFGGVPLYIRMPG